MQQTDVYPVLLEKIKHFHQNHRWNEEDLSLCGVILAEVLQGIRSDADFIKTKEYLSDLIFLPMRQATFVRAAEVYRSLRKKGITIHLLTV